MPRQALRDLHASFVASNPLVSTIDQGAWLTANGFDGPAGRELDEVLLMFVPAPSSDVRLLLGGDADLLGRCFAESWTRARAGRSGLLLRADPDLHGTLLHTELPRRDELPARPGRGWCVGPDGAEPLQVFLPAGPT